MAVANEPDATIVTVSGEMDLFASPTLSDALSSAFHRPAPVVVDLRRCSLFESSALNALLAAQLDAEAHARPFAIVCPPECCASKTLSLTVPDAFAAHASRDTALAAVAA